MVERDDNAHALARLRAAFAADRLTLWLGAGVSMGSGLPGWDELLRGVFINTLGSVRTDNPRLAQAVAETWFEANDRSKTIVARELKSSFASPDDFVKWVRFSLYKWIDCTPRGTPTRRFREALKDNATLMAVAALCRSSTGRTGGVRRVVSYNFDDLLELGLDGVPHRAVWSRGTVAPGRLPIYHVHGFLPARSPWVDYPEGRASRADEIVLTEDQYHGAAATPYGWANLVQLQAMTDSVGLAIGLSMTDPNMRRLLDIASQSPVRPELYALLPRRDAGEPSDAQLDAIVERLGELRRRDARRAPAGRPGAATRTPRLEAVARRQWRQVFEAARRQELKALGEIGVHPVWCRHDEIPRILDDIATPETA